MDARAAGRGTDPPPLPPPPRSRLRQAITTSAPRAASRWLAARPMPEFAPVTITTCDMPHLRLTCVLNAYPAPVCAYGSIRTFDHGTRASRSSKASLSYVPACARALTEW